MAVRERNARGPVDPRLLRHARASRGGIALLVLIGFGQALTTIAIAAALCGIVTAMTPGAMGVPVRSLSALPPTTVGAAIAVLAGAFLVRGALAWAEQVAAQRTAARVADELRQSLLDRILHLGPAWVAAYGPGRLTTVLGTGLDSLRPWFSGYLPALVLGVLLPPLVVVIMALVDPASAVVALLTIPLLPLLGALIGWATKARAERRWAADSRLAGHFLDVVRGLPTLKMYGRADRQIDVIADLTDRHRAATMRVLRVAFLSSTALDLVGTLAVGLIAVQAGLRVAAGSMDLGPALFVILLAPEAYRPLREMAARYHASTDAGAVIADVDEILSASFADGSGTTADPARSAPDATGTTPSPTPDHSGPDATGTTSLLTPDSPGTPDGRPRVLALSARLTAPGPAGRVVALPSPVFGRAASGRWGVRATGLRARYPGAFEEALDLPELTVRAGELVALQGMSGAGKTTALRVLAGLHPAESGAIAVGSTFYLPQRPALPHARTVAGAFPAGTTDHEIHTALHLAGLTGELTGGTPLGEQVAGVSAGQRQRLALAVLLHRATRAVTGRRTASVVTLLLDEPTAHLDSRSERLVIDRLHEFAAQGCAVLVVAHRPALLAAADRVVNVHPPAGTLLSHAAAVTATMTNTLEVPSWTATPSVAGPSGTTRAPSHPYAEPSPAVPAAGHRIRPEPSGTPPATRHPDRDDSLATSRRAPWWARVRVAALLGAGSSIAGIVLTGAAAWLLVRASSLPPVLSLSAAVVLVRGSAVARPLLRYLERLVSHEVAFARLGRRRAAVYANLIPLVPGPRLHRRGDLLTRLVDDVDAGTDGLLRGRLPVVAAAVTAGLGVAVVAATTVQAAVAVAVGLLVAGVLAPAIAGRQADRQETATGSARAALRDAVVETVDGVEELAAGGGRVDVPQQRSRTLADLEALAARGAGFAAAVAHAGWGAAVAGVAVVLARGGLTAEWSAVMLLGVVVLGEAVTSLPEAAIARRRAAGAERRVAALIENGPVVDASGGGDTDVRGGDGAVRVRGLVAGWDPGRVPVLDGTGLELAGGSRTAIMGRSGCGKSTLAAVLAGLLPPFAGDVEVSGTAVLVGDETGHVFASTVRENLRLASPAATDAEMRAVLVRVGLGWMDLDSWLGTGGGTISGGQRRRLATARALLADPALLILDEPTEGIDEAGARELMADLLAAAAGRTVLVLAHRTDGLDLVDRVLELDANGRPVLVTGDLGDRPERDANGHKEKNVGLDRSVL
ncbi:thiol reductant ABC exporter subunit CydC [Actinoplanes subglobosus]|uniref:Thiol reductant ABC exporter subunit CydC n=1 Tax=Actinoplanes subglobosus TaxID=1547892 RepID=A0ABV8IGZ6_9ACTN